METNANRNLEFKTCCPSCKLVMLAQNEWMGMGTECPKCKTKFIISPTTMKCRNFDLRKFFRKKVLLFLGIVVFAIVGIIAVNAFFFSPNQSVKYEKGLSEYEKRQWKSHFMRKYYLSEEEADQLVSQGFVNDSISLMYNVQASGRLGDFHDDLEKLHRQMGR